MQMAESRHQDWLVVRPAGRFDSAVAPTIEQRLVELLTGGERKLVIDFSEVDYISSAGLRVMLVVARRLGHLRGSLVLCALAEPVRQVFDLAGFLPLFTIEPTPQAALQRLGGGAG